MSGRRPDFFIAGAPKCGTTSLYHYLRQHPEVFMPDHKEPRFFAPDLDEGTAKDDTYFVRDLDEYLALFAGAGGARRVGEASTQYMYSSEAAERIRAFEPAARVIMMVRNPVDLMYALHATRFYNGNETIEDFGAALAAESERRAGRSIPSNVAAARMLLYRDVATLSRQVERFQRCFPAEQLKVIVFDDLVADPAGVYGDVLRFLDVDDGFEPEFEVRNANKVHASGAARWVFRRTPAAVQRVGRAVIPLPVRRMLRRVEQLGQRRRPRPKLDERLRAALRAEFEPEVRRLGELIGRDLSHWSRS